MEPPGLPPHPQMMEDAEHLKILAVFYYISAGLAALFGFLPVFYIFFGGMLVSGALPASSSSDPPPPEFFGWFMIAIGVAGMLLIWAFGVALYFTGRWLTERRRRTFCFVVAGLCCANFPLGTILGVFTIIVLQRPSVRALFDRSLPAGAGPGWQ